MTERDVIKRKIVNLLAVVSNRSKSEIEETKRLKQDLRLSASIVGALADSYTKIARHHGGSRITIVEARKLKTVKKVIDLVHKRANTSRR